MKKIVMFALAALALVAFGSNDAKAQTVQMPCGSFSNTQFICIDNKSDYAVSHIDCDGFRVNMVSEGGYVPAGFVGVGKFNAPFCSRVTIYTRDGRSHSAEAIDTRRTNKVTINPWRW